MLERRYRSHRSDTTTAPAVDHLMIRPALSSRTANGAKRELRGRRGYRVLAFCAD